MTRYEFAPGTVGMMLEDEDVARLDAVNATLRAVIREVRDQLEGVDPDEVYRVLTERLAAQVPPGFVVDPASLRADAEAISDGTLFG
jgi:hypothetical protein